MNVFYFILKLLYSCIFDIFDTWDLKQQCVSQMFCEDVILWVLSSQLSQYMFRNIFGQNMPKPVKYR